MTQPRENPKPMLDFGSEIVVQMDDGEEWSLFLDPRPSNVRADDWGRLEAADCQTLTFPALVVELESPLGASNGEAPAYQVFASSVFREQLKSLYSSASVRLRCRILDAMRETIDRCHAEPTSYSQLEFDLPDRGLQIHSAWPGPLVIHFAIDSARHAVYFHSVKNTDEITHE